MSATHAMPCRVFLVSTLCPHVGVRELAQLEAVCREMRSLIDEDAWHTSSSYLPTTVTFQTRKHSPNKEGLKDVLRAIHGTFISRPESIPFDGRQQALEFMTAIHQAQRQASSHLASGGQSAHVFTCRFRFASHELPLIGQLGHLKGHAECESEGVQLPAASVGNANSAFNLALGWKNGSPFLKLTSGETSGNNAPICVDVCAVSESLYLRMRDACVKNNGPPAKGAGLSYLKSSSQMAEDIAQGILCVVYVRDDPTYHLRRRAYRNVDALSIDLSHAALFRKTV